MSGGRRRLSTLHALAVPLGVLLGAGSLYIPKRVENLSGPATPVTFLLATGGVLAVGVGYAVFLSGPLGDDGAGTYLHVSRTWRSRAVGFLTVWPKPAAYTGLLALLAQYLAGLLALPVATDRLALVMLGLLLVAHLAGPVVVARLGVVLSGVFTLLVVGLVLRSLPAVVPGNFAPLFPTPVLRDTPLVSIGRGTLVALFGFLGFEAVAGLAGEVRAPRETLPRVLLGGVVAGGVLAAAMAFVALGVIPWSRMVFTTAPFVDAAASAVGVDADRLLRPGLLVGALAALVALSWAPIYSLAGLGEVVPPLGRRNRFGTPDLASALVCSGAGALVVTDAVFVGLLLAVPGLLVPYLVHGLTTAVLPRANPDLYTASAFRPSPRLLGVTGVSGAGVAALLLWQTLTLDPVVVLGHTRVGPAVTGATAETLIRPPLESVVPALVGWETLGVLVYVVARDYREERGIELESLTRL
jgi:amino acid transporter